MEDLKTWLEELIIKDKIILNNFEEDSFYYTYVYSALETKKQILRKINDLNKQIFI